jgi:outer membrane lipoprotein-sorting protein
MNPKLPHPTALFFLMLLALPFGLRAQDPQAILDAARRKINGFADVTVEFRKTVVFVSGQAPPPVEGKLVLKKPRFILHVGKQDVYCDGTTTWNVDHEAQEITINAYNPQEGLTPDRIFSIGTEQMRSQYAGAEAVNGLMCHKIILFPLQTTDYVSITVWVDQAKNLPRQTMTHYKNGSKITYTMTSIVSDRQISNGAFTYDRARNPTYAVEDLR